MLFDRINRIYRIDGEKEHDALGLGIRIKIRLIL